MTQAIQIIPRSKLDIIAWDACVQSSPQRIIYGYSWYLDAVLPAPTWQWVGLVQSDNSGQYLAIMPVPLRRKSIAGIYQKWVVHQPLFCQSLGVFSRDESIDVQSFFATLITYCRYGSLYSTCVQPILATNFRVCQAQTTHVLNLTAKYEDLYQNYTQDRKMNLRRAKKLSWTVFDSIDIEPLLTLFRDHHAMTIEGGVADWAYAIFRKLFEELTKRNVVILRYAVRHKQIEAGALFVCEGNRIIYLFNAASSIGRRGNARTLLLDQVIQERAGQSTLVDFESPAKKSIRNFYESFGAVEEPFYTLRWNRLSLVEKTLLRMKRRFYV